MKKSLTLFLLLSLLLTSCAGGGASGTNTGSSNGSSEISTSEPESDYVPDPSNPLAELFYTPTNAYRMNIIDHSLVQGARNEKSYSAKLTVMGKRGFGGFVTNIPWTGEYVDDLSLFAELSDASEKLLDAGLNLWLYDELGYPSGGGGGRTVKDNPEYSCRGIAQVTKKSSGKTPFTYEIPSDVLGILTAYAIDASGSRHNATVTDTTVSFAGVNGEWTLYIFVIVSTFEGSHAQNSNWGCADWVTEAYLNLMDKNAVAEFINNTYRPYAENFRYFGDAVGVFTDEPSLMEVYQNTNGQPFKYARISWVDGFAEKFEEMHGYSILENFHLIFADDSTSAKLVRVNYRQTVGELVSESYFGQLNEFCKENGTKLSGHLLLEEGVAHHAYYYGDLMQCIREMGIAGVDSLHGNDITFMSTSQPTFMAAKYAASVTTLKGDERLTMAEICAVDFETSPMTKKEMRKMFNTLNLLYFSGITTVNSYVAAEKFLPYETTFTSYFARLGVVSREAEWDGDIALYYPINTFQAYSTPINSEGVRNPSSNNIAGVAKTIYEAQMDFTVADNRFFREAEIVDGTLTNGNVSFKAVCVPGAEVMPLDVLKKLIAFEEAGGTVVYVGCTPTLPDKTSDVSEFSALASKLKSVSANSAVDKLKDTCDYGIVKAHKKMYVGKYTLNDSPMLWVFNYQEKDGDITVNIDGATGYDIYDPLTGEITYVNGAECKVNVIANNACFIVARTN